MSKFEELCQAYAAARIEYRQSCHDCEEFANIFITGMREYFECPLEIETKNFDEEGWLHFHTLITLYENPKNPLQGDSETVKIYFSVHKIIDNYVVSIYPTGNQFKILIDEPKHFNQAYEYIFEKLKNNYIGGNSSLENDDNPF